MTRTKSPPTINPGTPTSKKKLSEAARKLSIPPGIVGSDWPRIRRICAEELGVTFDPWQDGAGGLLLARGANGKLIHTVGGFGMCICRQTGKTFFFTGSLFGLCIERPGLLVIWSSHHSKTHNETFGSMQGFAKRLRVAPHIDKVYTGSGDEEVRFRNGSRILFGARERGFGRGIPGVDVLVSDEAQILSERAMQDMLATLNVSSLGLHIYAGTPPKPEDNSVVFTTMREEAWAGEVDDIVWIEFGADDDADLDDRVQYAKANPSYPHRTPIESILRLRRRLGEDGFRREGLGIWSREGAVFDVGRWSALADRAVSPPQTASLMVDVSPDRAWSCVALAGDAPGERTLVIVNSIKGTTGVVPLIVKLQNERDIIDVAISSGAARLLEPDLVKAGIVYEKMSHNDLAAAYGAFQEAVKEGTVTHVDQQELNVAIANAKTRLLYSGETEAFDRRGQFVDISPAIAAAGAHYRFGLLAAPMPLIM